jgi:hypothetical protein
MSRCTSSMYLLVGRASWTDRTLIVHRRAGSAERRRQARSALPVPVLAGVRSREPRPRQAVVDGPRGFANSAALLAQRTNPDYALVRLHGRNEDPYNVKGAGPAAERFDYDYPDQELKELVLEVVRARGLRGAQHALHHQKLRRGEGPTQRPRSSMPATIADYRDQSDMKKPPQWAAFDCLAVDTYAVHVTACSLAGATLCFSRRGSSCSTCRCEIRLACAGICSAT